MKKERLKKLREAAKECCGDGIAIGFCEGYGCRTVVPLLDHIDALTTALEQAYTDINAINQACNWDSTLAQIESALPKEEA